MTRTPPPVSETATARQSFTAEIHRLIGEAEPTGREFALTATGHSVMVQRAHEQVTVRVYDSQGARVEATEAASDFVADDTAGALWEQAVTLGLLTEQVSGPTRRPRRLRAATPAGLLDFAADHLRHVGLHHSPPGRFDSPWRDNQWTGPCTVPHAFQLALRVLRDTPCEDRDAVRDRALRLLADRCNGAPVQVPNWWTGGAYSYLLSTVANWDAATGRTAAGAVEFLRAAARAAELG
ncbi:DUF6197 family protein [Kitasatospora sp. RB6PN24]|uniref:DUF6197 family protein n=1 Tax=Kitasatospora humi TaxID=2893891 RepID=UPI001E4BA853|nr:DUF6197 family protein [Kitasatospora humi]MCC9309912.1 DUF6197 family protein [Kitasatospora humi]